MKSIVIFILFSFWPALSHSQSNSFLQSLEEKFAAQQILSDTIIYYIETIITDKSNNDSLRVAAVHLLYRIKCDRCISFLLHHINDRFSYGNGNSELDQANYTACWTDLLKIADIPSHRWKLFSQCLYSLQTLDRDDMFMNLILTILLKITSKEVLSNA